MGMMVQNMITKEETNKLQEVFKCLDINGDGDDEIPVELYQPPPGTLHGADFGIRGSFHSESVDTSGIIPHSAHFSMAVEPSGARLWCMMPVL